MTYLVTCLSSGKGTWSHVFKVMQGYRSLDGLDQRWEKIFVVTSDFFKDKITSDENTELVVIDENRHLRDLSEDIFQSLKGKIVGFDVAVNLISGSGKEHMAILSALLKLGLAVRFIALTEKGVQEI